MGDGRQKNALISVFDKTGVVEFARKLVALNFNIYSSGGTAKKLASESVPVTDVSELVGGDAILGHRVVTLSREIHAGLLARVDVPEDMEELAELGIPFLDLVYCNMYPLMEEIAKPEATLTSVIDQTDIGGPTMIRSAAKGRRLVVCDQADQDGVIEYIEKDEEDLDYIQYLIAKAEFMVSRYIFASAEYHGGDKYFATFGEKFLECKYGENAYQSAGVYSSGSTDPLALDKFISLSGNPLSSNNICDLDRLLNTATHLAAGYIANFSRGGIPYIAIAVKHGNPCGASYGSDKNRVLQDMVTGDTRAIFGGLVLTNFEIDEEGAEILMNYESGESVRLLDGIIAPSFSEKGFEILEKRAKTRLVVNESLETNAIAVLDQNTRHRYVRGGNVVQSNYDYVINIDETAEVSGSLSIMEKTSMILAWAIGCTSNSNTVTLVHEDQLIGNGVGQQDRVGCCELAIKRATDAGHETDGAIAYSDSFFPFADGPEVLIEAGIMSIFASSGSVRDDDVISLCKDMGVTLCMAPDKVCRGFFGH
jgi:phosphoribosylaminoimidazolecarboxamide formyltransferase / IMP cyclohydrolase